MFLVCSFIYPVPLLSAEDFTPLLMITANDIYLTAGEENQIEIELKNVGSFSVYEVEALLISSTPGISVIDQEYMIFNKIEDGKTKRYNSTIYVDRNTPLGTYTLTYIASYVKKYKLGFLQPHIVSVQLGIVVQNVTKPLIRLNVMVEDAHIRAGAEEEVDLTMENIGEEPLYEIDAVITSTSPYIAVLEGARLTHGFLNVSSSVSYQSTIAVSMSAPLSVYTLTVAVSYEDGDGQRYLETFTLGVNVDSVEVAEKTTIILHGFEVKPVIVYPGDGFGLELELACKVAEAHEVKTLISFDPGSSLSSLSPTLVALGDLKPNQTAVATYRVLVDGDAKAGQYPVRVTISYLDSYGIPNSIVDTVTLSVNGIVNFELLNLVEVIVEEGGVADLEADLLLIGTESVEYVQIDIVEAGPFRGTLGSYEYIGPVDPDSPVPFDLQFAVGADAEPGSYTLMLNVTYFDDLNQVRVRTIEIPVYVVDSQLEVEVRRSPWGGFWLWLRRLFGVMP